jgi:NAD(P)-dependent dehydrogenase (short-subunit alcohol dehydrogenase family)
VGPGGKSGEREDSMGKTILITGCSSGIGNDAATTLHRRGWRVFATCRKEADAARLRDEGLESFRLDYADESTLAAAVAEVGERTGGKLDALFNNGAYALPGAAEDLPRDALREIFETNLFGPFDLIKRCLPMLYAADRGRIVNCSSVLGFAAIPFRGAYSATKSAMESLTDSLRRENKRGTVKFILIEPGPIATLIRQNSIPHFEKWIDWEASRKRDFYRNRLRPRLYEPSARKDPFQLEPRAVTKKLIHAIEARRPKHRYFVTVPTYFAALVSRLLPTSLQDAILG